jgi:hypothetical protein
MNQPHADSFIQKLEASTDTIGRLGFLSTIIPIFLPFVFGISVYRARQCGVILNSRNHATDSRIAGFRTRFITSAIVSAAIMLGLIYWMSTLIWHW